MTLTLPVIPSEENLALADKILKTKANSEIQVVNKEGDMIESKPQKIREGFLGKDDGLLESDAESELDEL